MNKVEKIIQGNLIKIPRIKLVSLPTPLEKMQNLKNFLRGPNLFIKRDDLMGGNKMRKLEFFMADAKQKEAHTVITFGAAQSNHARETATACNKVGLKSLLILAGEEPNGHQYQGNLLLDKILGANVRLMNFSLQENKPASVEEMERVIESTLPPELKKKGYYIIPIGGYTPL